MGISTSRPSYIRQEGSLEPKAHDADSGIGGWVVGEGICCSPASDQPPRPSSESISLNLEGLNLEDWNDAASITSWQRAEIAREAAMARMVYVRDWLENQTSSRLAPGVIAPWESGYRRHQRLTELRIRSNIIFWGRSHGVNPEPAIRTGRASLPEDVTLLPILRRTQDHTSVSHLPVSTAVRVTTQAPIAFASVTPSIPIPPRNPRTPRPQTPPTVSADLTGDQLHRQAVPPRGAQGSYTAGQGQPTSLSHSNRPPGSTEEPEDVLYPPQSTMTQSSLRPIAPWYLHKAQGHQQDESTVHTSRSSTAPVASTEPSPARAGEQTWPIEESLKENDADRPPKQCENNPPNFLSGPHEVPSPTAATNATSKRQPSHTTEAGNKELTRLNKNSRTSPVCLTSDALRPLSRATSTKRIQAEEHGGTDGTGPGPAKKRKKSFVANPTNSDSLSTAGEGHQSVPGMLSDADFATLWQYCVFHAHQPHNYSHNDWESCRRSQRSISHLVAHYKNVHGLISGYSSNSHNGKRSEAGQRYLTICPENLSIYKDKDQRKPGCKECESISILTQDLAYDLAHSGPAICLRCYDNFPDRPTLQTHLGRLCINRLQTFSSSRKARILYTTFCSSTSLPKWAPPSPTEVSPRDNLRQGPCCVQGFSLRETPQKGRILRPSLQKVAVAGALQTIPGAPHVAALQQLVQHPVPIPSNPTRISAAMRMPHLWPRAPPLPINELQGGEHVGDVPLDIFRVGSGIEISLMSDITRIPTQTGYVSGRSLPQNDLQSDPGYQTTSYQPEGPENTVAGDHGVFGTLEPAELRFPTCNVGDISILEQSEFGWFGVQNTYGFSESMMFPGNVP